MRDILLTMGKMMNGLRAGTAKSDEVKEMCSVLSKRMDDVTEQVNGMTSRLDNVEMNMNNFKNSMAAGINILKSAETEQPDAAAAAASATEHSLRHMEGESYSLQGMEPRRSQDKQLTESAAKDLQQTIHRRFGP